jgi:hypothetical protein
VFLFGPEAESAHETLRRLMSPKIMTDAKQPGNEIIMQCQFGEEDNIAALSGYRCTVVILMGYHLYVFFENSCVYNKRFDVSTVLLYRLLSINPDATIYDMAGILLLGRLDESVKSLWVDRYESLLFQTIITELLQEELTKERLDLFVEEMGAMSNWERLPQFFDTSYRSVQFFMNRRNQP